MNSIILNLFKSGFNLLSFSLVLKLFTSNLILFHAHHTINFVINNFNGNLLSSVALRPFVSALRGVGESLILKNRKSECVRDRTISPCLLISPSDAFCSPTHCPSIDFLVYSLENQCRAIVFFCFFFWA